MEHVAPLSPADPRARSSAGIRRSSHPAVSAFPESVVGSACTSSFSRPASAFTRVAARTLAPSPIRDLLHRRLQPFRHLHDCSGCFRLERFAGWGLHPLESAAFSRRTQIPVIADGAANGSNRSKAARSADYLRLPWTASVECHQWAALVRTLCYAVPRLSDQ